MHFSIQTGTILATFISASLAQDALSVLRLNGLNTFADKIEADPSLLSVVNGRDDVQLYAVPDSVYASGACAPPAQPRGAQRRQTAIDPQTAVQATKKPPAPRAKRDNWWNRKKGPKGPKGPPIQLPPSNFDELISVIDGQYPGYSNLGPGQPQRLISNLAGSFGRGGSTTFREVTSGGGDVVRTTQGPYKYNKGIIYVVNT
jgi:hypothetical protein